jgi:hypothetical protein
MHEEREGHLAPLLEVLAAGDEITRGNAAIICVVSLLAVGGQLPIVRVRPKASQDFPGSVREDREALWEGVIDHLLF